MSNSNNKTIDERMEAVELQGTRRKYTVVGWGFRLTFFSCHSRFSWLGLKNCFGCRMTQSSARAEKPPLTFAFANVPRVPNSMHELPGDSRSQGQVPGSGTLPCHTMQPRCKPSLLCTWSSIKNLYNCRSQHMKVPSFGLRC